MIRGSQILSWQAHLPAPPGVSQTPCGKKSEDSRVEKDGNPPVIAPARGDEEELLEEEGGGGLIHRADGDLVLLRADQVLPQRLLWHALPQKPALHLLHLLRNLFTIADLMTPLPNAVLGTSLPQRYQPPLLLCLQLSHWWRWWWGR